MPLPSFTSFNACMVDQTMRFEFPDAEQRAAVCHQQTTKGGGGGSDTPGPGGPKPSGLGFMMASPAPLTTHIMATARRRITQAKITHISLVPRGANRMPVIFKADDHTLDVELLVKVSKDFMEKGELTAIVYAPEQRDSQGDIASAEVIKQAMYDAARDGVKIDVRHDGVALNKAQAFVAESFIVQPGDPRFAGIKTYSGKPVDPVGSWGVVMKIDDPALRQKYRDGEWNGVSMGGTAVVEADKEDHMAQRVVAALAKRMGLTPPDDGDIDMDATELTAALTKSNESLAKQIVEGVTAVLKTDAEAKAVEAKKVEDAKIKKAEEDAAAVKKKRVPLAPIFKGDPTNADAIEQHQRNLALYELRKDVDWSDMESVNEYLEKMGEFEAAFGELTEADKQAIKGRTGLGLRKAAGSTVPPAKGDTEERGVYEGVSKEDVDAAKVGVQMAAWCNENRGFAKAS